MFKIVLLLFLLSLYNTSYASNVHDNDNYDNYDNYDNVDIEKLLNNMDWNEQIGQMIQIDIDVLLTTDNDPGKVVFNQTLLNYYIGELGIGCVLNHHYKWTSSQYRNEVIKLQNTAQQYNRLPIIWGIDNIHGSNYIYDSVITPQSINIASSFNKTIAFTAGKLSSYYTRKSGITWIFNPLFGLGGWNPFWSRIYETFGEDPILVSISITLLLCFIIAVLYCTVLYCTS
jgi:beta-glucosidase